MDLKPDERIDYVGGCYERYLVPSQHPARGMTRYGKV
jgi:hypothetical protein